VQQLFLKAQLLLMPFGSLFNHVNLFVSRIPDSSDDSCACQFMTAIKTRLTE